MPFKTILLPVDGSEPSMNAARLTAQLAGRCHSQVHILHCFSDIPSTIGGEARKEEMRLATAEAEKLMEPYKAIMDKAGIPCATHAAHGDIGQNIVTAVEKNGCDVIIMGNRGLGSAEGFVLGSISQQVLELSPVPVLVAR